MFLLPEGRRLSACFKYATTFKVTLCTSRGFLPSYWTKEKTGKTVKIEKSTPCAIIVLYWFVALFYCAMTILQFNGVFY
jgi:hypothetical protein